MNNYKYFNNMFVPTQGECLWSDNEQNNTIYKEFLPCRELQPCIACYWMSKRTTVPNEVVITRIIPDGCMDIVFNINNLSKGKGGVVIGTMTSPEENLVNDLRHFVGVRFWPGAIFPFIKNSAKDFTNKGFSLEYVWGKENTILNESVYEAKNINGIIKILEKTLKKKLLEIFYIDSVIQNMLYNVYKAKGNISIKALAMNLNISQRQLSRKVNEWIGVSPKTFNNIVRFQNIINELNTKSNRNFSEIALNNGYYDQAHFIKKFKAFYGKTPGQL